ncbi:MAG: DUF3152 domain-containing protein [Nitriliruptoraceae bacterium]
MRRAARLQDRRVVSGLIAVLVVLTLGVGAAAVVSASLSAPPGGRTPPAPVAAPGALGPAAGEVSDRSARWWFTPWPIARANEIAAGTDRPADEDAEPHAAERGSTDGDTMVPSASVVDEADLRLDGGDAVAMRTAEGFEVAAGGVAVGDGPEVTYTVELEPAVGEDLLAFTAAVEEALGDPRSWSRRWRLVRVDDPSEAAVRVLLATPTTVDRLCGQVGLRTVGRYSCWTGRFAALNAWRWAEGAPDFDDLTTYRRYLVNHEVGHALGFGHVGCEEPGAPAPVMMQQSMGTGGCVANSWPYP